MRNLLDDVPTRDLHGILLHATRIIELADIRDRMILDIGCGFGWFELFAIDNDARGITGIEISAVDLRAARAHVTAPGVSFEVASAVSLPFDDASFDTVVCWEVLEHIPVNSELDAFREIRRVLRPNGAFYMSTPYASVAAKITDPAWWLIGHRHYRKRQLSDYAHAVGLTVEGLEVRGGGWLIASLLNLYVAKWVFGRPPFMARWFEARVDSEIEDESGFVAAFMRCRLPR